MEALQILEHLGSVARTKTLLDRGVTRSEIGRLITTGTAVRLREGVIALPTARRDFAVVVMSNGFLTCASAARHLDLWQLHPPASLHLSCRHARPPQAPDGGLTETVINHRERSESVHPLLPVLGLTDVLLHALRCLPLLDAVVIVESAVRFAWIRPEALVRRLDGDRNGRARKAMDLVQGDADSPIEVVARLLFRDNGIFTETQVQVPGVGRVDFLLDGFLVVELDGAAYHSDRKALRNDRRRNNMTIVGGYLVLRYTYEDIMFAPDEVLAQVVQVLSDRFVRR